MHIDTILSDFTTHFELLPNDRVNQPMVRFLAAHGGIFDVGCGNSFKETREMEQLETDRSLADAVSRGFVSVHQLSVPRQVRYTLVPAVGMGATVFLHSDSHAYEVISVSTGGHRVKLRSLSAERDPSFTPDFTPGGFVGHTANNRECRYRYHSDPKGNVLTVARQKDGTYRHHSLRVRFGFAREFYDSNY